jgi:hypothetical protein
MSSLTSVGTAGEQVTITATVKDSGNRALAAAPVLFSTDTGTLVVPPTVTDANGMAAAKFNAGGSKSNRLATITVTSGTSTAVGTVIIPIAGSRLTISGATTLVLGASTTLTIKATDSAGNVIVNAPISMTSSLSNTLSVTSGVTDGNGLLTLTYTARNPGTDTLTYSGLGVSGSGAMLVSGDNFTFVSPVANVQLPVGAATSTPLQVQFLRNGAPIVGQVVNFATTGGSLDVASGTTNAQGIAATGIRSNSAGPVTILATAGTAQATIPVSFIATQPSQLVLQVSPAAIGPNAAGSFTKSAQVVAKVTDANSNPVPNIAVNFSKVVDPSGGDVSSPSAMTDINGLASVQYFSGPNPTPNNGVQLKAVVANVPTVIGTTMLTVNQQALFLSLGTGNTITNLDPAQTTYRKDWIVTVLDAGGAPVAGKQLTVKILPVAYRKGSMVWCATVWCTSLWDGALTPQTMPDGSLGLPKGTFISCANEDSLLGVTNALSYNGVLDAGEDFNGDGKLWPGGVVAVSATSAAGATTTETVLVTDATGRAALSLTYPESLVPWVEVRLQVLAQVAGTAGMTDAVFVVEGMSSDLTAQAVTPAGLISPFGQATTCSSPK